MDCDHAQDLITRSISGNASPADEAELRRHLASCPTCAEMRSRLGKVWDFMGQAPRVALSDEQSRAVSSRVRRSGVPTTAPVPSTQGRWAAAGLAAACLIGIGVYLALPQTPVPSVPEVAKPAPTDAPAVADEPVETQPDMPDTEYVKNLLQQYAEEQDPKTKPATPPAPAPKKPEAVVKRTPPAPPKVEQAPTPTPAPTARVPETPEPPAPAPEAPVRETVPIVASLARAAGTVFVMKDGEEIPATPGLKLMSGHGLGTRGLESQAVVEFKDGTRLVMGGDSTIGAISESDRKRVVLDRGVLACDVARQPKDKDMIFSTPHADARVLGTRLTLTVNRSTLLEVHKGRVRLTRRSDDRAVDVARGKFAVAGPAINLTVRKITRARVALSDPFSGSRWSQMWSQRQESGLSPRFKVGSGRLSLPFPAVPPDDVAPGTITPTPGGTLPPDVGRQALDAVLNGSGIGSLAEWPRTTWLETRRAFPLVKDAPLRIRVKLWQSHSDAKRTAWICLNRRVARDLLLLERRGDTLQLWAGTKKTSLWKAGRPSTRTFEDLELWLTPTQVVVRRNDETLHVGDNPSKSGAIQVSLGGGAKKDLPQDQEVRFDDVEVAWMSQADLTRILK